LFKHEKEDKKMMTQIDPKVQGFLALPPPDHIAVVVRDIQRVMEAYTKLFQWAPFEVFEREYSGSNATYHGKPGNFKYRIALAQLGPVQLELIQPLEGETIYDEFLETHGEGIHHLGVEIDHIEERIAAMKQLGIEVLQSGKRPGRKYAYMDTEPLFRIILELREKTD
jgi:methylmalonyl-CoA/ethylmalonyl-CoA epimerase